jgi:hypothetical protein
VLRAREGLLTKETLELVGLGIVRDIHRESANAIVDVVVATRG